MIQNETFKAEKSTAKFVSNNRWIISYKSGALFATFDSGRNVIIEPEDIRLEHLIPLHDICTQIQDYESGR